MEVNVSNAASCEADSHAVAAVPVVVSVLWVLFCLFYHTKLLAISLSWLANRLSTNTYISIGSVRISLLAGRILFRNVHYATLDYSISVVDGYISLKWWKGPQNFYRDWQEVQLVLQLNGVQFHWYNRTEVYKQLERKFFQQQQRNPGESVEHISAEVEASDNNADDSRYNWLGVTPNILCNMQKVKVSFGNDKLLDHSLVVYLNKGCFSYTYEPSPCRYDEYRYIASCKGFDVEVFWEPNKCLLDTNGARKEKIMFGRSQEASLVYTVDVPGVTPNNRESTADLPSPEFTMDIILEKPSEIHYGPSINRQRALLQKLFFPPSYCEAEVSQLPAQGEKRVYAQFVVTVTLVEGGHLVIPFTAKKDGHVDNLKLAVGLGSYVKITQPWITFSNGYTTIVEGNVYSPSLTSSLAYPPVGQAHFAKLRADLHFPRQWNGLQTWDMQISLDELNCNILFPYIDFIGDLLDDWNAGPTVELLTFVPLQWQVAVQLCSYEVFLYTNHYNWVDIASLSRSENSRLAVCGETGTLNFDFPFTEFLPALQKISFSAEGQNLALRRYVPLSSTTKESIFALSQINRHRWRWPSHLNQGSGPGTNKECFPLGWVHNTTYQDGWVDLASSHMISLHLTYSNYSHSTGNSSALRPNVLQVEAEVPDIVLRIFGVLARDLLGLKANYTGDFPDLAVFDSTDPESVQNQVIGDKVNKLDPPPGTFSTDDFYGTDERFLEIRISFKLPNGTAEFPIHLPRDVGGQSLPLPSGHADMLLVEFAYRQNETRVSIHADTISILVPTQGCLDGQTILGQLTIPSVLFRGHGMNETLCQERVEYAWLMDLDVGCIEGSMATEQVMVVVEWLQATIPHVVSPGDEMEVAPGGVIVEPVVEPLAAILKYRSFTVSVQPCDVSLLEEKHLLRLVVPSFGLAACNLQSDELNWGITFLLHGVQAHIYSSPEHSFAAVAIGNPSLRMTELGQMTVGRIRGQIHTRDLEEHFPSRQLQFLLKADALQRRLYFLWPGVQPIFCVSHSLCDSEYVCGCFGGCCFFDSTLEKNKFFVQLQQETVQPQTAAASNTPFRGSLKRRQSDIRDEPDCAPLLISQMNAGRSVNSRYSAQHGSLLRQRQIHAGEVPLSSASGVTCVHTTLARLSRRNAEDVVDYSSLISLNRNSLYSLNSLGLEVTDDIKEVITSSSSAESFMSALSELTSDIEEPTEDPQPELAKDLPAAWTSTVTFCPYIISTCLAPQRDSDESQARMVTILCPRYRSHLPSFLPKVSLQLPVKEIPVSPVTAKVSVSIRLVEKCSMRLTSSALEVLECFIKTAERCLEQRNPAAVVDLLLDRCLSHTGDLIQQNRACKEQQQQQNPSPDTPQCPLLHLSVGMSSQSYVSLQLVVAHKAEDPISSASLLTVFVSGISCTALVKNHLSTSDAHLTARKGQLEQRSSFSSALSCQALQLQVITLNVNGSHTPTVGSSKLNFALKLPSYASRVNIEMRDIIEMGVAGAGGTVLGTKKKVITPNILSTQSPSSMLPKSGNGLPTDVSRVAAILHLKEVWLQAAAPRESTVQDITLVCRFADQWQQAVTSCASSVDKMVDVMSKQEKRVLAHLLSNFLQQDGEDTPDISNKVHSPFTKSSQKLRSSAAYQICRTLPSAQPTTDTNFNLSNVSIVAMVMGLGCRIFKRRQRKSSAKRPQNLCNTDYESCNDINQMDYTSLRLLQHTVVPLLWSCGLKVHGKPHNSQFEIEVSVTLNSVSVQIAYESVDSTTKTPEASLNSFVLKCNLSSKSQSGGTCSLLFDMEKPLQLASEDSEPHQAPHSGKSSMKTCGTIEFGTLQVNASVPLLRYGSAIPAIKKSLAMGHSNPSRNTTNAAMESVDEADIGPTSEPLDPFSQALILTLMAVDKDGKSSETTQAVPVVANLLPSSPPQSCRAPPIPTSLDILVQAEEGQFSDQPDYSHASSTNQLRVPILSGSESCTPVISDDTDYPARTPSPDSIDHHPVSVNECVQQETEAGNNISSVFLLFNAHEIVLSGEVVPFRASLVFHELAGSVDLNSNQYQKQSKSVIPGNVSVSGTLQDTVLSLSNMDISTELASVMLMSISMLFALSHRHGDVMEYQAVVQSGRAQLDVKQSPIVIHQQFQTHFPKLQQLYQEIIPAFAHPTKRESEQVTANLLSVAPYQQLPVGSIQVVLKSFSAVIIPLPSLTVSCKVPTLTVLLETASDLRFSFEVAESVIRFSPKVHKDEVALGTISLPPVYLGGTLQPATELVSHSDLDLELMIKEINVDLTTDVLNQLLVVQIAFIKELNELVQTLISIRESITGTKPDDDLFLEGVDASKDILRSFQFTLQGITVTVTTPSATAAVRFSTNKIDAMIKKSNKISRSIMALSGRVEVDLTLALGYLLDSSGDADDFKELVLFETKISIKNSTSHSLASVDNVDSLSPDSFHITIQKPHLYLQSSGIEKALIFWLHCESAYSHWLEERKAVTDEVQKATTQLMDNISTVEPPASSTLNFQQPKLIQISVNDVGACIPLIPTQTTSPFSKQKGFPALVLGIKEMRICLNLSHHIISKGHFVSFGLRFTESFNLRQRAWATLTKKRMINYALVPNGTYSLCMDRKRAIGMPPQEKVVCFFQFLMSGLELHANSAMGRYISLLTKAFVFLKGDELGRVHTSRSSNALEKERTRGRRTLRKTQKGYSASVLTNIEQNLAKQSRTVNRMRQLGETDKLQAEIESLQRLEHLAAEEWRKSRKKKAPPISIGNFTRFFSPLAKPSEPRVGHRRTESLLIRSTTNDDLGKINSETMTSTPLVADSTFKKSHRRTKSDIHDITMTLALSGGSDDSKPSSRPASQLSTHGEEEVEDDCASLTSRSPTPSPTPTLDFEISFTVEVESGKMFFYNQIYEEEDVIYDTKNPKATYYSPILAARNVKIHPSASAIFPRKLISRSSNVRDPDVTFYIPAVQFHSHYYSALVTTDLPTVSSGSRVSRVKSVGFRFSASPSLPSKKGFLLFSVNIDSLPAEMKLQPSLLEFMEQIMKPLKGSADSTTSNDSDSAESDSESNAAVPQSPTQAAISFPVEVTIFFHVRPSMVTLSCQPYSNVECSIGVPDVNLCCSFILFSPQMAELHTSRLSSSSSSSISPSGIRPFNDLCVSGAVQAFSFDVFNTSTAKGGPANTESKKEVVSLNLGLASVHVSRQAVKVMSSSDKDPYEKMKISVVLDVASVVLGFDMRRLNDLTAFRKCWYRKSGVESFMVGSHNKKAATTSKPSAKPKAFLRPETKSEPKPVTSPQQQLTHAEIVCVANISDLSCTANVSTVMGNTSVILNQFTVEACADVKSSELVYLNLECILYSAHVDARNGVIAGDLQLEDTKFDVETSSEHGTIPKHTCTAQMKLLEVRIDFMMSSVLAGKAADFSVNLRDNWQNVLSPAQRNVHGNESIQIISDVRWDQAKLVICRSTTASLEDIVKRLKEFVLQQKRRSERTFLLMWRESAVATPTLGTVDETDSSEKSKDSEKIKYHHWTWGTKESCLSLLRALNFTVTNNKHSVSFMGTINISGNSVCLACLHGPTFRETEWALFSLCHITASFSTQAIPTFITSARSHSVGWGLNNRRICQQIVSFSLGDGKDSSSRVASVFHVVNKGAMPLLTNQPLAQWVSFVCLDHHIHPDLPQTKLSKYTRKVNISDVFGLPALKLKMVHDHLYPSRSLSVERIETKQLVANVVCSFVTTFQDSIAITTTADHYFFLHNLVKAYVDTYTKSSNKDNMPVQGSEDSESTRAKRDFSNSEWQLDPHLVLLAGNSWTSGTVNIGWLLEMLGFQEAKTTIPQSIQCGVMDLLDKAISNTVKKLISMSAKKKLT